MTEGTLSSYGGSAQEAADSRRTQEFLNQCSTLLVRYERGRVVLSASQVYIVEYHAGGSGTSRKELCDYAPHLYRLETEDGTEVHLVEAIDQPACPDPAPLSQEQEIKEVSIS